MAATHPRRAPEQPQNLTRNPAEPARRGHRRASGKSSSCSTRSTPASTLRKPYARQFLDRMDKPQVDRTRHSARSRSTRSGAHLALDRRHHDDAERSREAPVRARGRLMLRLRREVVAIPESMPLAETPRTITFRWRCRRTSAKPRWRWKNSRNARPAAGVVQDRLPPPEPRDRGARSGAENRRGN